MTDPIESALGFHEDRFAYWLENEKRYSPHTLSAYTSDLKFFVGYVLEHECLTSVAEVRHSHVRAWIVNQMEQEITPRSINRRLTTLKTYFNWLKKQGIITKNPMLKVLSPKVGKRLPVWVPEKDMTTLFQEIDFGTGYKSWRDRLIMEVFYNTGMRLSELNGLQVADIDFGRYQFRIRGKGDKMRLIPFTRPLGELMGRYLDARNETFPFTKSDSFFLDKEGNSIRESTISATVKKYLSMVTSIERRSPHILRHTFATHLADAGADLKAIQELLGHASLASTQVYTHNSIDKLRRSYEQAHPKAKEDKD